MEFVRRAVAYIRVSDDPQADLDRASLPEQEHAIKEYCRTKGYELVAIFSDVGKRWEASRPEFQRMIAWGKQKPRPYEVIVVWRADRIVGSASTVAALEPLLDRGGIDIEGVAEPVHKQWLLFNALIGKGETEAKRERGKLGVKTAIERGHYLGTPPYGRRLDKEVKEVVLNESEAYWYREMFAWSIAGDGDEKTAKRLNDLGVPTRWEGKVTRTGRTIGKGWTRSYVRKLLTDCASYGEGCFEIKGGVRFTFPLPAVVDKPTFDQEKKARQARLNFSHRPTNRSYLISPRKGRCAECGLGFRIVSRGPEVKRKRKDGTIRVYQRKVLSPAIICRGMHNYPHIHRCRKTKFINFDTVQTAVLQKVSEVMGSENFALAVACPDTSEVDRRATRLQETRDALKQKEREISFVVTEGRTGKIPKRVYNEQIAHLNEVLEYLESRVRRLEKEHHEATNKIARIRQLEPLLSCWRGFWQALEKAKVKTGPTNGSDDILDLPMTNKNVGDLGQIIDYLVERFTIDGSNNITIDLSLPLLDGIEEEAIRSRQIHIAPSASLRQPATR
jgi:DNA invertase Pin-like site-specific DNA recombinase